MDFNVTKYRKLLDMISNSTLQVTYEKPSIKGEYS